ncbi:MAG: hypothetical protein KAK02_06220, partial [Desulfobulbaceae bacterium]|nr:hypothetical protein [Desulfobulbaceae bacterium]
MKERYRFTENRSPSHLVWIITFLGLFTTMIMAMIVWWTLADIRRDREELYNRQNEFSELKSNLLNTLDIEQWELSSLLAGKDIEHPLRHEELSTLIEKYRRISHNLVPAESLILLENSIYGLTRFRQKCFQWQDDYNKTLASAPAIQKKMETLLRQMDETVSKAEGKQRLERATRILDIRDTEHMKQTFSRKFLLQLASTPDMSSVRRDINDLSLLYERLRGAEKIDNLTHLKDNSLRTTLARLKRIATLSPEDQTASVVFLRDLLAACETTLFGVGYTIDLDHQIIIPGQGGLFNLSTNKLTQRNEQEELRSEFITVFDAIRDAVQQISENIESLTKIETIKVESSLKRTWKIILFVGVATGIIFLIISHRIISAIKMQIKAIEDTNIMLDNKTKALLKSEQALQQSEERLQDLSSSLLSAQEHERRRISLELHDELGQSMAALKLQISSIERKMSTLSPEQVKAECNNVRQYINEIIENVRRLSRDLSPVVLDDLGLEAAIEYLVNNFSKLNNIKTMVTLPEINHLFSQESQRHIYRILQESLNNISKHSKAGSISLLAEKKKDLVAFTVKDDGVGFDVEEIISTKSSD